MRTLFKLEVYLLLKRYRRIWVRLILESDLPARDMWRWEGKKPIRFLEGGHYQYLQSFNLTLI